MGSSLIQWVQIYKDDAGRWTTDIRGERALLAIMTPNIIHLVDGTTVGRWHHNTWEEAREFVFGPTKASMVVVQ